MTVDLTEKARTLKFVSTETRGPGFNHGCRVSLWWLGEPARDAEGNIFSHVWVSTAMEGFYANEVMAFPAVETKQPLSYYELAVVYPGNNHHPAALKKMGFIIPDLEEDKFEHAVSEEEVS